MKEKNKKEVETTPKEEVTKEDNKDTKVKMREIIIITDGNSIEIKKAEVSGKIELVGILQNLINFVNKQE